MVEREAGPGRDPGHPVGVQLDAGPVPDDRDDVAVADQRRRVPAGAIERRRGRAPRIDEPPVAGRIREHEAGVAEHGSEPVLQPTRLGPAGEVEDDRRDRVPGPPARGRSARPEPAASTISAMARTAHVTRSISSTPIHPRGTLRAASSPKAAIATTPGTTTGPIRRRAAADARATRTPATTATVAAQAAASASPADAAVRPAAGASTRPSKLVGQATQSAVEAPVTAGTSPSSTMHAT